MKSDPLDKHLNHQSTSPALMIGYFHSSLVDKDNDREVGLTSANQGRVVLVISVNWTTSITSLFFFTFICLFFVCVSEREPMTLHVLSKHPINGPMSLD